MTVASTKVFIHGTHRVRVPEETWAVMEPLLERYGVTRISDVTGLDILGIPVAMAARPLAWTLCVSQGKGQTLTLAKVSAAMECVELWHAERAAPPIAHRGASARELAVPYSVLDLGVVAGPFLSDDSPLDWVEAVGMISGRRVPVPVEAVMFPDPRTQQWTPASIRANSNGLASGNIRDEAALHALYEVVERDVMCRPSEAEINRAVAIDPDSIPDETCLSMVRSIKSAGGRISIQRLDNDFGVPTFRVLAWSWEFPMPCGGYGSHSDPLVAVSRAVTEAAQGRLAAIVGSRDDLEDYYAHLDKPRRKSEYLGHFPAPTSTFSAEAPTTGAMHDDVAAEVAWLCRRVQEVIGSEPLLVDLSSDPAFAVVKVLFPGAVFGGDRVHSRLERSA